MTLFVLLSWILCISTSFILVIILLRYRFLLIKPTIIIITFFHFRIQWAATFQAGFIENYLPQPFSFFILVQIFPLVGLAVAFFTFHESARMILSRLSQRSLFSFSLETGVVCILLIIVSVISIFYISNVSFSQTGLYTIFSDPLKSAEAREASLTLVENQLVKYGFSFLKHVFAPLLSVFLMIFVLKNIKRKYSRSLIASIALVLIFFIVSITGERAASASLILTIIWAFYLNKGMPFRPHYILLAILLVLTPPVLISILREDQTINLLQFFEYLRGGIFRRVFVLPMEVGLNHVHYAQVNGFVGIAAIPKISALFGIQPIYVANLIYLTYYSYPIKSGLANSCYVLSYYSYFGILSVFLSLFCLWILDFVILVFKKIKNNMLLLACVASIFTTSISFIANDFTIVLWTHGFLLLLFIPWLLDKLNTLLMKNRVTKNYNQ